MRLNCSSVSRLLNASLDAASLHVQARNFLNIVTSHAFVIHMRLKNAVRIDKNYSEI